MSGILWTLLIIKAAHLATACWSIDGTGIYINMDIVMWNVIEIRFININNGHATLFEPGNNTFITRLINQPGYVA